MVGDAAEARMRRHRLILRPKASTVAASTSGGPARKIVPFPLDNDRFVSHCRNVSATGCTRAEHRRNLRNAFAAHARHVVKRFGRNAPGPETHPLADAEKHRRNQPDRCRADGFFSDGLGANVFLDGFREVRAAL